MTKYIFFYFFFILCSCSSNSGKEKQEIKSTDNTSTNEKNISNDGEEKETYKNSSNLTTVSDGENEEDKNNFSNNSGCKFTDGTYSATVDYNNPETGYSNTYTLEVEVEGCQVVKIYFPKGGWLDEDHITAADIDEDGNSSVDGDEGRTYEIQIDN